MFRDQLLIVGAAAVAMFTNLGATRLWDQDEAYFAGAAAEMHARGDWITPYFNGELFAHKPPLMYWMMLAGFRLFGTSEFAARFGSALCGVATALLVYHFGRRLFSRGVGLWAALALGTCLMFDVVARAATPDGYLVFFVSLAVYLFATRCAGDRLADDEVQRKALIATASSATASPRHWLADAWNWSLVYAAMGLAVLTKGLIGVLLPAAVIGMFLMLSAPRSELPGDASLRRRLWEYAKLLGPLNFARAAWRMRPWLGVAVVILVAGPWFLLVHVRTNGAFTHEFVWKHHVERFLQPLDNHQGPWWYYVPAILGGFFPWSVFAIPAAHEAYRTLRGGGRRAGGMLLLICWMAVFILFFSKASTKLPNYVLPAYPAIALVVGCFIDRCLREAKQSSVVLPRASFGVLAFVGGILVAGPLILQFGLGGSARLDELGVSPGLAQPMEWIPWLGGVLLPAGVACLLCDLASRRNWAFGVMAAAAVLFIAAALGGVALSIDRLQSSDDFARAVRSHGGAKSRLAQYGYFRPSLVYYTRDKVEDCPDAGSVAEFLAASEDHFVITPDDAFERIRDRLPPDVVVVERRPQFPKRGEVLLLSRRPPHVAQDQGRDPTRQ